MTQANRQPDAQRAIAQEILAQLGGNRFMAMTGAKNLLITDNGLCFSIPASMNGINKVRIDLNSMDTYDVTFFKIRGTSLKTVALVPGIYNDALQSVFTAHTGLNTTL